jgi:hypothetical protein
MFHRYLLELHPEQNVVATLFQHWAAMLSVVGQVVANYQ